MRGKGAVNGFWKAGSQFLPQLTTWFRKDTIKSQFVYPGGGQIENEDRSINMVSYIITFPNIEPSLYFWKIITVGNGISFF